ncbi:extracellular solute-binding protein [Paenibacillus lemnae]|uniref:Extracellular solute-binding protein n=1 Tax=Paenibacillus lemnae TaxID=1330551 RepID=A0A848M6P4_PAELE|nr:extracellular solute-binding protein [Paenibacillus lemnae]NMO95762.1 extracellular solute-binding protein [Paenibacillus lemnae]
MSNKPDRITFQKRLEDMVGTLRREIITRVKPAGDYLPSELALAEQYKLSKKSVRKGLELLVSEGLITKVPRVGNRINSMETEGSVSLKIGIYPSLEEETDFRELISTFCSKYPHIQVETIALPYHRYPEAIKSYLDHGWLDVITLNHWNFLETKERESLHLFEEQEAHPDAYPFLQPVLSHNGILYGRPFVFSPVVLCYNKELLKQSGISEPDSSWSWKDLSKAAKTLKKGGSPFGFYAHIASTNRFPIVLLQEGYRFQKEDGKYVFNDPELWKALSGLRDVFYSQGAFSSFLSEADADAEKLFLQQKAAMIMTTYYGLKYLKNADFAYDLAPVPYHDHAKTIMLVTGLAVNRQSKQKEAARLLVDFLTSAEAQLHIRQHTLSIPASKHAAEWRGEESMYRPSRFQLYREIIPTFGTYDDLAISIRELDMLRNELKLFWANMEEAEQAAQRLAPRPVQPSRT